VDVIKVKRPVKLSELPSENKWKYCTVIENVLTRPIQKAPV